MAFGVYFLESEFVQVAYVASVVTQSAAAALLHFFAYRVSLKRLFVCVLFLLMYFLKEERRYLKYVLDKVVKGAV